MHWCIRAVISPIKCRGAVDYKTGLAPKVAGINTKLIFLPPRPSTCLVVFYINKIKGDIMHKCISILMIVVIVGASPAVAKDFRHGDSNECYYISGYGKKSSGNNWAYYYCGGKNNKCAGKKSKSHDLVVRQNHGDKFTYNGKTYWCCDGKSDSAGRYVQASAWIDSSKTVTETKQVDGGTCTVKTETDVCGGTYKIDCDTPGTCNAGYVMRNKVCAQICPDGSAFESNASNKCVECETTNYQGIKMISSENNVCIKCDQDTQFFDKETKTCINKSRLKQISQTAMKKCWRCPDEDTFAKCVEIVQRPLESLNFADNTESATLKRCHVDKNSLDSIVDDDRR